MSDPFEEVLRRLAASPVVSLGDVSSHQVRKEATLGPGDTLAEGRYMLEALLGEGGFGEVWRAVDGQTGQPVAMKLIKPDVEVVPEVPERFEREIQTIAWLAHPDIVRLLDEGSDEARRRRYFTMEMVAGKPMYGDRLGLEILLEMMDRILQVLAYAHARGVIHRDLKPENVMVEVGDEVGLKLLDFGIAHVVDGTLQGGQHKGVETTAQGVTLGTVYYMSPEQAAGEASSVGPASDLYALGIMLYEALSGRFPFEGDWLTVLYQHVCKPPPPLDLPELDSPLGREFKGLIEALLNKRYEDRPECAADVRRQLADIRARLPSDPRLSSGTIASRQVLATARTMGPNEIVAPGELTVIEVASEGPEPLLARPLSPEWPAFSPPEHPPGPCETPAQAWRLRFLRDRPPLGREAECRGLWAAAERVASGGGSEGLALTGPVGVGKSRLARWLAESVHEAGLMRVVRLSLTDRGDLASAMHMALYKALRLPRLERAFLKPRVREVLGLDDPAEVDALCRFLLDKPTFTGTFDQRMPHADTCFDAWRAALRGLTRHPTGRPLLLWTDGGQKDDLHLMVRWMTALLGDDAPIFAIWSVDGVFGDVLGQAFSKEGGRVGIQALEPLAPGVQRSLALALVPGLAPDSLASLLEWCGGNPLFIHETLHGWLRTHALAAGPEGLSVKPDARHRPPERLEDLVRHQLNDLLDEFEERDEVQRALWGLALMGATAPPNQVRELLEGTPLRVEALMRKGWLIARTSAREPQLALAYAPLRQLLLEAARDSPHLDALIGRCVALRLQGSLQAMIRSDWEAALQNLHEAWRLLEEHPRVDADEARIRILDGLARVSFRQRETARTCIFADVLEARAQDPAEPSLGADMVALAHLWRGCAAMDGGEHEVAVEHCERAFLAADQRGGAWIKARVMHRLGEIHLRQGELDSAISALEAARESFATLSARLDGGTDVYMRELTRLTEADVARDMAEVLSLRHRYRDAVMLLWEVLQTYKVLEDAQGEAHTTIQLTRVLRQEMAHQEESDHEEVVATVERYLERAAQLMQALDDRRGHALLSWEAASLMAARHRHDDAERRFRDASGLFVLARDPFSAALCVNSQGEAARRAGRLKDALSHYTDFCGTMREQSNAYGLGVGETNLGWVHLELEDAHTAQQHFQAALAALSDQGPEDDRAAAHVGLAIAHALTDAPDEAQTHLTRAQILSGDDPLADPDAIQALSRLIDAARTRGWSALKAQAEDLIMG